MCLKPILLFYYYHSILFQKGSQYKMYNAFLKTKVEILLTPSIYEKK